MSEYICYEPEFTKVEIIATLTRPNGEVVRIETSASLDHQYPHPHNALKCLDIASKCFDWASSRAKDVLIGSMPKPKELPSKAEGAKVTPQANP